jgi:hypothetical protein
MVGKISCGNMNIEDEHTCSQQSHPIRHGHVLCEI